MSEHEDYEDIIQVPDDVMGQVIGKGGCKINEIRADTGARIDRCKKLSGFYVSGTKRQCTHAKQLIENILQRTTKETPEVLRYIPEDMKGRVIGSGGSALRFVSEETGAKLSSRLGQITLTGDKESRDRAHVCLKTKLNSWHWAKKRQEGSDEVLFRAYLEDSGRRAKAFFEQVPKSETRRQLQEQHTLYKIAVDSSQSDWRDQENNSKPSDFMNDLQEALSRSLSFAKSELLSRTHGEIVPLAELWCHFGRVHFRRITEEDLDKLWSPSELQGELNKDWKSSGLRTKWNQSFKEGVSPDVETLKQLLDPHGGRSAQELTRWDLNFLSPLAQRMRCKIWLLEDGSNSEDPCTEDMQHDLYYAVSKLNFKQPAAREKACGWICKSPRPRLKVNVIAPEIGIDCRLMISTVDSALCEETDTLEMEYDVLRKYLSNIVLSPNGGIVLPGALPKGFQLQFKRRSQRTTFTHHYEGLKFSVTVCKETSIETNGAGPMTGVDVYIGCSDWDDILANGEFEVKEIVKKFPVFWQFVKIIRRIISENAVLEEEEEDHQDDDD